jgi:uncharacterized protein YcbK (DUF882 family)
VTGLLGSFGLLVRRRAWAARPKIRGERSLSFESLHTGERLSAPYWSGHGYLPDALGAIAHVLRDHRTNASHPIDPNLLDLLHALAQRLDRPPAFQVISGYRSPVTNASLAAASEGVATHSLHMQGMAIDIRMQGVRTVRIREAALALRAGGVGYYPKSDFVHVDTGRVRFW